jgi:hypothetical protein
VGTRGGRYSGLLPGTDQGAFSLIATTAAPHVNSFILTLEPLLGVRRHEKENAHNE